MRVIGGEFRSRRLKSLDGEDVRPTPDRLRETLFNVIATEVPGSVFVDAYAGTGAVGIEALSRGAQRTIFIEKNRRAVVVIEENLFALDLKDRSRVIPGAASIYLPSQTADIVFLDPPYALELEYATALELLGARPVSLVIAQHQRRLLLASHYGVLKRTRELRQGDHVLSFFRSDRQPSSGEPPLPSPSA